MSDLPDELPSDPTELRAFAAALLDRCARLERLLTAEGTGVNGGFLGRARAKETYQRLRRKLLSRATGHAAETAIIP
jgi:hypothetical protein